MIIKTKYDWLGVHFSMVFPVLLPVDLPPYAPMAVTHETQHDDLLYVYTSGFV